MSARNHRQWPASFSISFLLAAITVLVVHTRYTTCTRVRLVTWLWAGPPAYRQT
jgi:hypothetical protein